MGKFFISYRRAGASVAANWIKAELSRRLRGHTFFLDTGDIRPGEAFPERLKREVAKSDVMLVLVDETWTSREGLARLHDEYDWVRVEIASAIQSGVRIVPIRIAGAAMPSADDLPVDIRLFGTYQAAEFRPERFKQEVRPLADMLRQALVDSMASRRSEPHSDLILPSKPVDLSAYVAIRTMKDSGMCAAYAAVTAMEVALAAAETPVVLDVDSVWKAAKKHDGMRGDGTSPTTVVYVIEHFGVPLLSIPRASPSKRSPPRKARAQSRLAVRNSVYLARVKRLDQYERIATELENRRPIFACVQVFGSYDPWLKSHPTGVVEPPGPGEELLGGHALTITRWDRNGIGFANSCGESWGDRGFGRMDHELARQLLFEDMYWSVEVAL